MTTVKINLPEQKFFTFDQLANRWGVEIASVTHLIDTGALKQAQKLAAIHGKRKMTFPYRPFERPLGSPCFVQIETEEDVKRRIEHTGPDEYAIDIPVPFSPTEMENLTGSQLFTKASRLIDQCEAENPEWFIPVVLLEDVLAFESEYAESERNQVSGKALATTERNTLLTIIAAICDYSDIKYKERGAAPQIARLTEEIGAPVTDDTIRKVLEKIPDALERRMK